MPAVSQTTEANPYQGLQPYQVCHCSLFFGRDAAIQSLYEGHLSTQPLTVIVGASGSGKSSLISGGLIPYLTDGISSTALPNPWYVLAHIRPGSSPLTALAHALLKISVYAESDLEKHFLSAFDSVMQRRWQDFPPACVDGWIEGNAATRMMTVIQWAGELDRAFSPFDGDRPILSALLREGRCRLEQLKAQLQADPKCLTQNLEAWVNAQPDARFLVVVDPAEELVTQGHSSQERQLLLEHLTGLLQTYPQQVRVVLGVGLEQEDALQQVMPPFLQKNWMDSRFMVPELTPDELRAIVEGPLELQALHIEPPDFTDRLIQEAAALPNPLPLLSFTLRELYIQACERAIEQAPQPDSAQPVLLQTDYEQMGGLTGAIPHRAALEYTRLVREDAAYAHTFQRVMRRLVTDETEAIARRSISERELHYTDPAERARANQVCQRLIDRGLLLRTPTLDGDVELKLAHDALIQAWPFGIPERDAEATQGADADQGIPTTATLTPREPMVTFGSQRPDLSLTAETLALQRDLSRVADQWYRLRKNCQHHQAKRLLWSADARLSQAMQIQQLDNSGLNQMETDFIRHSVKKRHQMCLRNAALLIGLGGAFLTAIALLVEWPHSNNVKQQGTHAQPAKTTTMTD